MPTYHEPEDVDFVVEGGETDPELLRETAEYIRQYKLRPEYAQESKRAQEILARAGLATSSPNGLDPVALLEHWKRCVENLTGHRPDESNGKPRDERADDR